MKDFEFNIDPLEDSKNLVICRDGEDEPLVTYNSERGFCLFSDECSVDDLQDMIGILLNYIDKKGFCFPVDPILLPQFKN